LFPHAISISSHFTLLAVSPMTREISIEPQVQSIKVFHLQQAINHTGGSIWNCEAKILVQPVKMEGDYTKRDK